MKTKLVRPIYLLFTLFLIAALLLVLPQAGTIKNSMIAVTEADPLLLAAGFVLVILTYAAAAFTLTAISIKPVKYRRTLIVQLASGFATKLVPAGIGGLALNARYLHKNKHSVVQATSVVSLNNGLGAVGHVFIIAACFLLSTQGFIRQFEINLPRYFWPALLILAALFLAITFIWPKTRHFISKIIKEIAHVLHAYYKKPVKLAKGLVGALLVSVLFAACLWLCALSLDVSLTILEVLWVFTAGVFGAAVTPTPGGLGGAEAALTAGLISVGIDAEPALSVALAYRLVSYWLPMLPGSLVFLYVIKRGYI